MLVASEYRLADCAADPRAAPLLAAVLLTLSRAAFRVLYDMFMEGDAKVALDAHIKKLGLDKFNKVTNFLVFQ